MSFPKALVIWQLNIGPLERVLLWAARADLATLRMCAYQTRQILIAVGLSLIFISVITFLASFLALIEYTFPPNYLLRWPLAICLALIAAAGMLLVNRTVLAFEAVGRKAGFILNVLILGMAVAFSVAVALPLEMFMFEDRVEVELKLTTGEASDTQPFLPDGNISSRSDSEPDVSEAELPTSSSQARKHALKRVIGNHGTFHLTLMGFMLLLELLPFMLKRDLSQSEYRCLLEARRIYNEQKYLSSGADAGTSGE